MFDLPFHPIVVHIPLALSALMPILIGVVLWGQKKEWFSPKTWLLLVFLQTLVVGTGYIAMQLGERDGEKVERVVAESFIEAHEEWAEIFVWTDAGLLVLMVVPVVIKRARFAKPLSLAGAVLALIPAIYAGHSGGHWSIDTVLHRFSCKRTQRFLQKVPRKTLHLLCPKNRSENNSNCTEWK